MDNLLEDIGVEIYRRVAATTFTDLAPLLLVGKRQSRLAFSPGVLRGLSLLEFVNNAELINETSAFRGFFKKCVAAENPTALYLESLRIATQFGDIRHAIAMQFAIVPESDYATFARGMFLIIAEFPAEGVATISTLFARVGNLTRLEAIGNVVYRHVHILQPRTKKVYTNLRVVDSIPRCLGNGCNAGNRCFNCFIYWYLIKLNVFR